MSVQNKHQSTITCRNSVSDNGVTTEKSNIPQQKEDTEDISLQSLLQENSSRKKLSTLVFRQGSNKETLIDKSNSSEPNTQTTELSQTLEVASISNEKSLKRFWKKSSKALSQKLWLPKEIDSQGLVSTSLNGFSRSTKHGSFQIQPVQKTEDQKENCQKILWQSSLCSAPDTTVDESIRYCRKIRIYPTKEQKGCFEKYFGATRYIWNNALDYIQKNPKTSLSHISLRKNTMLSDKQLDMKENEHLTWLKETPYDTRQLVLKQLASNFKTNFTLLKIGQIKFFEMKFKRKRSSVQVFFVNKKALNLQELKIFKRRLKEPFKVRKRLQKWIEKNETEGDCIVKREKNRYFLCIPMKKQPIASTPSYNRVALDPGCRTFQTFYSDQGIAGKIGDSTCEVLIELGLKEDKLKSRITKACKKRTKYNLRRRCFLLRTKMKNITKDLHWKACNYLCSNFKHILLPSFDTSKMVPRKGRKIGSRSTRLMLSLSHYAFKERLLYMGKRMGVKIDIVNEAYTTQTCGGCGNTKVMGPSKVYHCDICGFVLDRDYNGARNIFLKYLQ